MSKPRPPIDSPYLYVIVRRDLPQPTLSVQAAHAVLAATLAYGDSTRTHPNLVLCAVDNEPMLGRAFEHLKQQGVPCCAWYEDDLANSLTAIATGLLVGSQRRPLRGFPLLSFPPGQG